MQTVEQPLVDELVEELHLLGRILEHVVDDVLDHRLRDLHVAFEIAERHLGLDHPELGCVTRREGILRAERRSERVDVVECQRKDLAFELSADGQVGHLAEEILAVVDLAVFRTRRIVEVERGDLEHLAGTFRVTARDQRGMHIDKPAVLEEAVDRMRDKRTHTEHSAERVAAGTQMRDLTQELHAVVLVLQRIIRSRRCNDLDRLRLDLEGLRRVRCQDKITRDLKRCCDRRLGDLLIVRERLCLQYDLDRFEEGPVVEFDKPELVVAAVVADPSLHADLAVFKGLALPEQFPDFHVLCHVCCVSFLVVFSYVIALPAPPAHRQSSLYPLSVFISSHYLISAMHSISSRPPLGSAATSKQHLAGGSFSKYPA